MTKILVADLWPRLRQLSRVRRRRAAVAVPFLGREAAKQIRLRRGDVLVTKLDEYSVRQGLVSPHAIVQFIKGGVEVHSVANLHAKVFVFGRVAIIASSNISSLSENNLIEVGCELSESSLVTECRRFVNNLRGDIVELEFAKRLMPLYRPPRTFFAERSKRLRRRSVRQAVHQSDLITVGLTPIDYDEADQRAATAARESAQRLMRDRNVFRLDDFRWDGPTPQVIRKYRRVLLCTDRGNQVFVAPPARILEVRHYKSGRGSRRSIVAVEIRKHLREKRLSEIVRRLGREARILRKLRGAKRIENRVLVYKLGQLWPSA